LYVGCRQFLELSRPEQYSVIKKYKIYYYLHSEKMRKLLIPKVNKCANNVDAVLIFYGDVLVPAHPAPIYDYYGPTKD
jgi:hypothetical protein